MKPRKLINSFNIAKLYPGCSGTYVYQGVWIQENVLNRPACEVLQMYDFTTK